MAFCRRPSGPVAIGQVAHIRRVVERVHGNRTSGTDAGWIARRRASPRRARRALDDRSETEPKRDPRNAMERTVRILERMFITVINEHLELGPPRRRFEAQPDRP